MKKKGFTLIELLAVIVILAIIALIATPIILSMIENAKKSASKSSALGYFEAIDNNNGFADANVDGYIKIQDGTYEVADISVPMKGQAPDSGEVTIAGGKVSSATICTNGYTVTYNGHDVEAGNKCAPLKKITTSNFGTSSITWQDIKNAYVHDKTSLDSVMDAGITKDVTITGYGTHPVRIVNTTPCSDSTRSSLQSKTACGLVLEFTDNLVAGSFNDGTAMTDWTESSIYQTYFASTGSEYIYNKLPADLKSVIIDTTVVSGHGASTTTNAVTTDKLYMLSLREWNTGSDSYDAAGGTTTALDFYNGKNADKRAKKNSGSTACSWSRTITSDCNNCIYELDGDGNKHWDYSWYGAANNKGFSAAFRLSD